MSYSTRTSGIYAITNNNTGQQYVGQSVFLESKWTNHKSDAKRKKTQLISKTIRSYGHINFTFKVLEKCPEKMLSEKEMFYIAKLNTWHPNGYNVGSARGAPTRETLSHIPAKLRGNVGQYLREKRVRNRRARDPKYDAWCRAGRARRAKNSYERDMADPTRALVRLNGRRKGSKTFRQRMLNPKYAARISAQRRKAAKASALVRCGTAYE